MHNNAANKSDKQAIQLPSFRKAIASIYICIFS